MKKTIYILILFVGLFGCTQTQTNNSSLISEKIKGNWKTEYFKRDWNKTAYIFTFQDSTCSYKHPWGEYSKYWIKGDTLNIKERLFESENVTLGGKIVYQFLIDKITAGKLFLKPLSKQTKKLFTHRKSQNSDIIKLSKITKYRDWKIERIGFYSTGCFGTCPLMFLEIDSVGNMLFNGKMYTKKEGLFFGVISKKEFKMIKSEINSINLSSLKKMYLANWTDDQTCGVIIKTKEGIYESSAYGFNKEPIELRVLFHRLLELYKNVELKKDTTIVNRFQFNEFQKKC